MEIVTFERKHSYLHIYLQVEIKSVRDLKMKLGEAWRTKDLKD
jgi:hypothetical protein